MADFEWVKEDTLCKAETTIGPKRLLTTHPYLACIGITILAEG